MKGEFELEAKFDKASADNCFISEITLAELKFGVEKSEKPKRIKKRWTTFYQAYKYFLFSILWICMQKKKLDYKKLELQLTISTFKLA